MELKERISIRGFERFYVEMMRPWDVKVRNSHHAPGRHYTETLLPWRSSIYENKRQEASHKASLGIDGSFYSFLFFL